MDYRTSRLGKVTRRSVPSIGMVALEHLLRSYGRVKPLRSTCQACRIDRHGIYVISASQVVIWLKIAFEGVANATHVIC